jgi:photosystem II stability/assembly factor-like uncharacterized protein
MQLRSLSLFLSVVTAFATAQSPTPVPIPTQQQVWQMQDSGTTAGLRGIDSVDGTVAWTSGTEGTVLKTTDGGVHWTKCAVPDAGKDGATLDFRGVQAWDAMTAIVMASGPGDKSRLYKTTDGCRTWVLLFKNPDSPGGFFDSFWINPFYKTGILLGDPVKNRLTIFDTSDAGANWQRDNTMGLETGPKSLAGFAASNSLLARFEAGYSHGFVTGGEGGAFLIHRWREGSWSRSSIPLAAGTESSGAFSLGYRVTPPPCTDCAGPFYQFAVAVGGDFTKPNDPIGTAAWSSDGGQRWTASTNPPHGYRSAVQWGGSIKQSADRINAWITVGTNGSDISRDDGRTWQPLDNGNWNALSLPFIVGPKGRIGRLDPSAIPKGN